MNRFFAIIAFLLITVTATCQNSEPQMADTMRSEGKIYVVVTVLCIVFACLATYLIIIDKKLKKLENKLDEALSNETSETLNKFLTDKTMSNNKQQTAVEWLIEQLEEKGDARETPSIRNIQFNIDTSDYLELKRQAKEMEKEQSLKDYQDGYNNGFQIGQMEVIKKGKV